MKLSEIATFSNIGVLCLQFFLPNDETGVCARTAQRCKAPKEPQSQQHTLTPLPAEFQLLGQTFGKWGLGCLMVSLSGENGNPLRS
jgi:hypothetical protein